MEAILNYSGLILGLILAVVGLVLQVRSNKKKIPVYSIKSNNLISGTSAKLEKLKVSYEDIPVDTVTVSKILFYNSGEETITNQDIKTKAQLHIGLHAGHLLDFKLLLSNNASNNIVLRLREDNDSVYIDFDYLDKDQGAVFQFIHSGLRSEDIAIDGAIMGVQKITKIDPDQLRARTVITWRDIRSVGISLLIVVAMFYLARSEINILQIIFASGGLVAFLFMLMCLGPLITMLVFLKKLITVVLPSNKIVPAGLETFNE